jgi:hypothetical protein
MASNASGEDKAERNGFKTAQLARLGPRGLSGGRAHDPA